MANSERLAALGQVRQARNAVSLARMDRTLTPEQQAALARTYMDLDDVEGNLILSDIGELVDKIKGDAAELQKVADQLAAASDKLSGVARLISNAANAVGALVQVIGQASTAGLLG